MNIYLINDRNHVYRDMHTHYVRTYIYTYLNNE